MSTIQIFSDPDIPDPNNHDSENAHNVRGMKGANMKNITGAQMLLNDARLTRPQASVQARRAPLGNVNVCNQANVTRVQPLRHAKHVPRLDSTSGGCETQDENTHGKSCKSTCTGNPVAATQCPLPSFVIHEDKSKRPVNDAADSTHVKEESSQHDPHTRSTVTNRGVRLPLAEIDIADVSMNNENVTTSLSSPMSLDTSTTTGLLLDNEEHRQLRESRLDSVVSVVEYSADIQRYLRQAELRHRPKPTYMRKQPDITASMRSILVDWLVEVAQEYHLHRETLFLTVNYIDRFLSQMSVLRNKLQLVGAASMFVAAKYEEIYPPEVGEFVYITDDSYTKKQVLRMEHLVLRVLSFDVAVPTVNCFCEKLLKESGADPQTYSLVMYIAELSLLDVEPFLAYLPSVIAAASLYLANCVLGRPAWAPILAELSGYETSDLRQCVDDLHAALCRASTSPQQAKKKKVPTATLR